MKKKKLVGVDIDGTLRNLADKFEEYLEIDHPHKLKIYLQNTHVWDRLGAAFDGDQKAVDDWLYGNRAFHIFGQAPKMYRGVIDHLNALSKRAQLNGDVEIWISSVQRDQSIIATLFWLAKNGCKVPNIKFFNSFEEKHNFKFDYVIDDRPSTLEAAKKNGSVAIVIPHPYNEKLTEKEGYHRLDYSGKKPTGLAGAAPLIGLDTYQIVT